MNEQEKLAFAKRRVEALTGFYLHGAIFVGVMLVLLAVNVFVSPTWWVQWPFIGWGIGLAGHALAVFGDTPQFIRQWQAGKIDEIKQKL